MRWSSPPSETVRRFIGRLFNGLWRPSKRPRPFPMANWLPQEYVPHDGSRAEDRFAWLGGKAPAIRFWAGRARHPQVTNVDLDN